VRHLVVALVMLVALAGGGTAAQPRMNDGAGQEMPARQDAPPPAEKSDRRPILVAAGIVLLGLVFLWNRRNRAALERESEEETRRLRTEARAARAANPPVDGAATDDPDADDLRDAAASDQEPK
jgi:hypothetical protein